MRDEFHESLERSLVDNAEVWQAMATQKLKALARAYLEAREAQEREHTDPTLNHQRTEAHDALMLQMDRESIPYASREEAAEIAQQIVHENPGPGPEYTENIRETGHDSFLLCIALRIAPRPLGLRPD